MDFVAAEVIFDLSTVTEVWGLDTCLWEHRWTYQPREELATRQALT